MKAVNRRSNIQLFVKSFVSIHKIVEILKLYGSAESIYLIVVTLFKLFSVFAVSVHNSFIEKDVFIYQIYSFMLIQKRRYVESFRVKQIMT